MKKLIAVILALVIALSLCACGSDTETTNPSNEITEATNTSEVTEPTTEATIPEETEPTKPEDTTDATEPPSEETEPTEPPVEDTDPTEPPVEDTKPTEPPVEEPQPTEPSHTHAYTEKVTKKATCSAKGEKTFTCSCGDSHTEAIDKTAHNYSAATCTAPKTCTACGATSGKALGHSYKAATCTAPKTCTTCGTTEGSTIDHSYDNGVCTACGAQQEGYSSFANTEWEAYVVNGSCTAMNKIRLTFWDGDGELSVGYWYSCVDTPDDELQWIINEGGKIMEYEGTRFYTTVTSGSNAFFDFTETGNTVEVSFRVWEGEDPCGITLERISDTTCKVIAIEGNIIAQALAVGDVLEIK